MNSDLGQKGPAARLQRCRDSRDLAGKAAPWFFRGMARRVDAGPKPESCVLQAEHLGPDHVRVHQREHEGRSGCYQTAVVDVALCDHAVEWRHHALVGLLLLKYSNLG